MLALRNVHLRLAGVGLLLCLAQTGLVFAGVHPGQHLPGAHSVAFTYREALQFARHTRLDHGRIGRPQRARNRQAERQRLHTGAHHLVRGQHHGGLGLLGAGGGQRRLLLFAVGQGAPDAARQNGNNQCNKHPGDPALHGAGLSGEDGEAGARSTPFTRMSAWLVIKRSGSRLVSAVQGPMECFHMIRKIIGAITLNTA